MFFVAIRSLIDNNIVTFLCFYWGIVILLIVSNKSTIITSISFIMISIRLLVYLSDNSWKETKDLLVFEGYNQRLLIYKLRFS